jgi:hypothetical protein
LVGILVRESRILPGTTTLSRGLPWLLRLRIVLLTLPCTHREGRQRHGGSDSREVFGSRRKKPSTVTSDDLVSHVMWAETETGD